jgi:hypothetical protein
MRLEIEEIRMRKLASFALAAAVGLSAAALAVPADAAVVVGVGVPGVVLAPPVAAYAPPAVYPAYYGRYYPHRFFYPGPRFGYGAGFYHHGGYRGRYWR